MLIYPPHRIPEETLVVTPPPLGVAYLASVLRKECDVTILDATMEGLEQIRPHTNNFVVSGLTNQQIIQRIEEFKPDMVGLTCLFSSQIHIIKEIISEIKALDQDILIAIGGTYPSFLYEECMKDQNIDFICIGEGEQTAVDLVRGLREGSIENIDGLVMRGKDGSIMANPRKHYIEPLDELPFPAWDLMKMKMYHEKAIPHSVSFRSKQVFTVLSSRGCTAKCIFCSSKNFWGPRYRSRSAENVLDEIGELVNKWGIKEIQFEDDNMTLDIHRAKAIFRGIVDRGYKIHINFPNGVALWNMDEETVELMKEAGCYEATLAVESGCQHVLNEIIRKPLDLFKAKEVRTYFKKHGIRTNAFYIVGFPGETKEQINETFRFARFFKTDSAYFFSANPLPGTELYSLASEKGYLKPGFEFTELTYTRSVLNTPDFKGDEIEKMIHRQILRYYLMMALLHPVNLMRKIFDIFILHPSYAYHIFKKLFMRVTGTIRKAAKLENI